MAVFNGPVSSRRMRRLMLEHLKQKVGMVDVLASATPSLCLKREVHFVSHSRADVKQYRFYVLTVLTRVSAPQSVKNMKRVWSR